MATKPKTTRTPITRGQNRDATIKALDKIGYIGGPKIMKLQKESMRIKNSGARMARVQAAAKAKRGK